MLSFEIRTRSRKTTSETATSVNILLLSKTTSFVRFSDTTLAKLKVTVYWCVRGSFGKILNGNKKYKYKRCLKKYDGGFFYLATECLL